MHVCMHVYTALQAEQYLQQLPFPLLFADGHVFNPRHTLVLALDQARQHVRHEGGFGVRRTPDAQHVGAGLQNYRVGHPRARVLRKVWLGCSSGNPSCGGGGGTGSLACRASAAALAVAGRARRAPGVPAALVGRRLFCLCGRTGGQRAARHWRRHRHARVDDGGTVASAAGPRRFPGARGTADYLGRGPARLILAAVLRVLLHLVVVLRTSHVVGARARARVRAFDSEVSGAGGRAHPRVQRRRACVRALLRALSQEDAGGSLARSDGGVSTHRRGRPRGRPHPYLGGAL
jgi:hypothetical protein